MTHGMTLSPVREYRSICGTKEILQFHEYTVMNGRDKNYGPTALK